MNTGPINDVAKLDVLAQLNDGGIAMEIIITGPLDSQVETLSLLEEKVRNYLREATSDEFRAEFEIQEMSRVVIRIVTAHDVASEALQRIESLREEASGVGVRLELLRN